MLFLVGLGLGDEKDITIRGLEAVRSCDTVFLEAYTSILTGVPKERLEQFYGREVLLADRERVEQGSDAILDAARGEKRAALLVVGGLLFFSSFFVFVLFSFFSPSSSFCFTRAVRLLTLCGMSSSIATALLREGELFKRALVDTCSFCHFPFSLNL